jgi:hypothetical protein
MSTPNKLTATFRPQAWINDHAVDIDGSQEIDITDSILGKTAAEIRNIPDCSDNDNLYYDSPDYSSIDHGGPFAVDVDETDICEFFGISEMDDLTDEIIAARRATVEAEAAVPSDKI